MNVWNLIDSAPEGKVIKTKIHDGAGARNERSLYKSVPLWWTPDGSMYVYYQPTHWRELTQAERHAEIEKAGKNLSLANASFRGLLKNLS